MVAPQVAQPKTACLAADIGQNKNTNGQNVMPQVVWAE
jgi:hypothetical protein